jgi:excisionase family DNA binding protein
MAKVDSCAPAGLVGAGPIEMAADYLVDPRTGEVVKDRTNAITYSSSRSTQRPRLLTIKGVAELLQVSTRHIHRLADGGNMPAPLRLGGARRWDVTELERWVADGCPPKPRGGRR